MFIFYRVIKFMVFVLGVNKKGVIWFYIKPQLLDIKKYMRVTR